MNNKHWRANKGEFYYYIVDFIFSTSYVDERSLDDDFNYKIGNYFKTKEQADKVAKEIENILNKHKND